VDLVKPLDRQIGPPLEAEHDAEHPRVEGHLLGPLDLDALIQERLDLLQDFVLPRPRSQRQHAGTRSAPNGFAR
jgi:hypothetical protein